MGARTASAVPPVHPVAGLVRSSSPAVLRDEVATRVTPHEVTSAGDPLDGAVGVLPMPSTRLVFIRYGGEVVVEAPATGDRVVAVVPLGPMGVVLGAARARVEDVAFMLERADRTLMRPDPWAGSLVLAADDERLARHRSTVFGDAEVAASPFGQSRAIAHGCRSAWNAVTTLPDSTPEEVVGAFLGVVEDQILTSMVLAWDQDSAGDDPLKGADSRVRELRDWLRANHGVGVGIVQMAQAVGLSVRQLQAVVQRCTGQTPTELLREVRLAQARSRLVDADPAHATVSSIAHRSGFAHLGRFSVQYRERFGESPSATLRGMGQ